MAVDVQKYTLISNNLLAGCLDDATTKHWTKDIQEISGVQKEKPKKKNAVCGEMFLKKGGF